MTNSILKGNLVISIQGYDKGTVYVVKQVEGKYAYLIDGQQRHFHNPKKKNIKHLKKMSIVCVLEENNISKTNNEVHKLITIFKRAMKNL